MGKCRDPEYLDLSHGAQQMTTHKSSIFGQMRRAMPEGLRSIIDKVEDHPFVVQVVEEASRAHVADRVKISDALAAVPAAHEKRIAAAGKAAVQAVIDEAAKAAAHREARAHARDTAAACYGLERMRDVEIDRLQRELRASAAPVVRDALVAVQHLSLNFSIPDLNSGIVFADNEGTPLGWGESPEQKEAVGLADWHAALRVQREVLEALEALHLQPIAEHEAAEAVSLLLRRLTAATAKIQAPGFELGPDGLVVRTNPKTLERDVLTIRAVEAAK
jgi:hypothetical protein